MGKVDDKDKIETVPSIKRKNTSGRKNTRSTVLGNKKKVNIQEGMKLRKKTSFRQMSLKESFSNQETLSKRLRPRKVSRNYCEDSVLQQNNKKLVNKLIEGENSKVPVYKSVKPNEESLRNESDIYDFKFDANDSKERVVAKRKGRLVNRVRQKRVKKVTRAKPKPVPPTTKENVSGDIPSNNVAKNAKNKKKLVSWSSTDIIRKSKDDTIKEDVLLSSTSIVKKCENNIETDPGLLLPTVINSTESISNNISSLSDTNDMGVQSNNVQNLETDHPPLTKVILDNMEKQPNSIAKPTIVSIEKLRDDKVLIDTPVKSNSEYYVPFRKTNIFKNKVSSQYGNMVNHSLINKSLSPIRKASEHFDPGSPWRLSPLNTFSQVRNLFQSTPQPRPIEILHGRIKRSTKDQAKNLLETVKKNDILETDNRNINIHKTLDKSNYITRKFGHSVRKFGTEITNLDHSVQSDNNATVTEQYEDIISNRESKVPVVNAPNAMNSTQNVSLTCSESAEDKENAAPKNSMAKKRLKKRLKKINNTISSPLPKEKGIQNKENQNVQSESPKLQIPNSSLSHTQTEKEEQSKENFNPQPGPSGLQKNKSPSDKPLQQTNLNAFLNITEMPQSIRISTAHGIFDDAHSTPIYDKPRKIIKQVDTERMEVDNAFGFKEDSSDSNLDISPIYFDSENKDIESKKIQKKNILQMKERSALPVRLLPPRRTRNIVQENVNISKDNVENIVVEDAEAKQTSSAATNKFINAVNFSDTFDILEEESERKEEPSFVPLFSDLEPVHFTQPPKRSYKRKRNVKFSFSESGSEDDEELDTSEPERKKKRYGKLKKADVQRMKQWIKNINNTFQEIDEYELHVE